MPLPGRLGRIPDRVILPPTYSDAFFQRPGLCLLRQTLDIRCRQASRQSADGEIPRRIPAPGEGPNLRVLSRGFRWSEGFALVAQRALAPSQRMKQGKIRLGQSRLAQRPEQ